MKPQGFPPSRRIRHRGIYRRIQSEGEKVVTRNLVFLLHPNDVGWPRLGLIVSRKAGNAVVRNRIKRVIREVFRQMMPFAGKGIDIVVIPRKSLSRPAKFHIVAANFRQMAKLAAATVSAWEAV